MIIGKSDVHDGPSYDLPTMNDWTNLCSMQAEDSTLWHVYDWSPHHRSEHTSIRDSECASSQIFKCNIALTSFCSQVCKSLFQMVEIHILTVPNDGNNQSCWSRDSSTDVDEVSVDHFSFINDSIHYRLFLERVN